MSIDLTQERERHAEALSRGLDAVVAHLRADPQVRRVVLFGSYAQGRRDLFTDLDLLVVMDSPLDFIARNAELCRRLDVDVAVDILAYTPEELDSIGHRPFIRNALASGRTFGRWISPESAESVYHHPLPKVPVNVLRCP